jgi:hypothetical protein
MTFKSIQTVAVVAALWSSAVLTVQADAQCCGTATTAYYQPAAYTAYSPVAYQTYRTGWYPGYFLDRIRTRLWGSPSTYVAAYPSPYVASYPSAYAASYPSTYVASYPSSYVASYPSYSAGYASSYSPCCGTTQQVTMRPTCCTSYAPACESATYGGPGVSQASYQSGGCASCGMGTSNGSTVVVPSETVITPGTRQGGSSNENREPELAPGEQVAPERTYQRPPNGGTRQEIQPEPGYDANEGEIEKVLDGNGAESSTYFEPPKLFDLNDRTARRTVGPVRTAVYHQPVTHLPVSAPRKITAERAKQDAKGWTSASN